MKSFAILLCAASALTAGSPDFERAHKLYNQTEFDRSLQILQTIPNKDAAAYALMGRNYYMQGDYKKATELLEKALAGDPKNAAYALWLGRSFGRRAESASVFSAPGLASKTRQYFEKSVQWNPRDIEALNDLFEYYLDAPGIMGGGIDKAQAMARQIAAVDASEGHLAQARIAENRKQYSTAEQELRLAVEAAPHKAGPLLDLADFLTKQHRLPEADQSLARAERIAPDSPELIFHKAGLYIKSGRNLDVARDLLQRYMTCNLTPDDPPRSEAAKLLRRAQGSGK